MSEVSCGKVTVEERDEIRSLFQRKNALTELFGSLAKLEEGVAAKLYEKLVVDMGRTATEFHAWWERKSQQYAWQSAEGANWRIDFDTCEVFLVLK